MAKKEYSLDRYLDASRTLSLDEFDWSLAAKYPLDPEIERCMVYMLRIEGQVLFYVRDLLNTRTAYIPEVAAFLAVWLYEEERHSRIFKRFLRERGVFVPNDDHANVRKASASGIREWFEATGARLMAAATPHFVAVHMAYGAVQELSTIHAYERLGRRSNHPLLKQLCESIAKDERRHFAFYFNQAARYLEPVPAQKLVRFIMSRWWKPVGFGIHATPHAWFMNNWMFGDESGLETFKRMDEQVDKLPGLAGLHLFEKVFHEAERVVREGKARGETFEDWVPVPTRGSSPYPPPPLSSSLGLAGTEAI
jgi:hypothetical protein